MQLQSTDRSNETIPYRISTGSIRSPTCPPLVIEGCSHGNNPQPQRLDPVLGALRPISRGRMYNHNGNLPFHGPPAPQVRLRRNLNTILDPSLPNHQRTPPPGHSNRA
jgi:hypothetical protein